MLVFIILTALEPIKLHGASESTQKAGTKGFSIFATILKMSRLLQYMILEVDGAEVIFEVVSSCSTV